jgi:diaminohydroxyphosphoribosylaminopyrimidine deaminase/5-amino-6-(5-phosphoribosylamino)uracil reductase
MSSSEHNHYMSQALQLAYRGRYSVSPNPMVGCLIVKNHHILGQGYHQRAGEAHAEIHALEAAQEAGWDVGGATAYVTLEPCCHYGKTPPCTQSLIEAGIKKIYVATLDPNPLVAGKGIKALEIAGLEVDIGLCQTEATKLNEIFFYYIRHKRPFVIAKWAMSLDGKTITHSNDTRDISCYESQQAAHDIRQQVDAILIGSNTAKQDNPYLTSRFKAAGATSATKQPIRIILSSQHPLPLELNIFDKAMPAKTIIATTEKSNKTWRKLLAEKNVEILLFKQNKQGQIDLSDLLDRLGQREITSLLVEGGMTTHEYFFRENLVNQFHVYVAPIIVGSLPNKKILSNMHVSRIARDAYFTADNKDDAHV